MKLLITNDDGFECPSLLTLCNALAREHDIAVVAPSMEQSAISQAISLHTSITFRRLSGYDFTAYKVEGTPSDCVKLALCHLFKDRRFDMVISGINPFENAGLSALYSGTVAGAREGATWGIPSVALSVWDDDPEKARYAADWTLRLLRKTALLKFTPGVFWSINFPSGDPLKIRGARVCEMSTAMFKDAYLEHRTPRGSSEYWLTGEKRKEQYGTGTDDAVLQEHSIAITPLQVNQTCEGERERLSAFKEDLITW